MKKVITILLCAVMLFSSCATLTNKGPVTAHQRTKPQPGQPSREVRTGAIIADVLFFGIVGLFVDFATGAIYKKSPEEQAAQKK